MNFDMGTLQQLFGQGNMSAGGLAGQLGAAAGAPGGAGAMAGALAGGQQQPGAMHQMLMNPQFQQMLQQQMMAGGMGMPGMPGQQPQQPQGPQPLPVAQPGMPGGGGMGMGMGRRPGYMAQGGGVQPRRLVGQSGGY